MSEVLLAERFCLPGGDGRPHRLRRAGDWLRSFYASGRLNESFARAERNGQTLAFRARSGAAAVVALWLLMSIPWPRNGYYLGLTGLFFLLGCIPFCLPRRPPGGLVRLGFVVLDAALVTTAILLPPPAGLAADWPLQTRLRGQEYLYVLLLLGEAALTYSPLRVLWTGVSIVSAWSIGFWIIYAQPTTLRLPADVRPGEAEFLRIFLQPDFVSVTNWTIQVVATGIMTVLVTLAVLRSRMHLLAETKAEVHRSDLARYVSPDVAMALVDQIAPGFGAPTTRKVAVLFADIVGFTGATEHLPPERTFALLRCFQKASVRIVLRHRGTLDKFLGDGFMVTFGGLRDEPDAAARAIACALDLQRELGRWNTRWQGRQPVPVRLAMGVHYGPVVVGNLGSSQRAEFTVVGDVVNVTSRLEKLTRTLGCTLAISDACVRAAGPEPLRNIASRVVEVQVKGRSGSLSVHVDTAGLTVAKPPTAMSAAHRSMERSGASMGASLSPPPG